MDFTIDVPRGWSRIEELCFPREGSKGYKSNSTSANVSVVNLYDTGSYVVNGEDATGETFDTRYHDYWDALAHARGFMLLKD